MKLKQLFDKPERWTQKASARDKDGNVVAVDSGKAYSFCLGGGVEKCYKGNKKRMEILNLIEEEMMNKHRLDDGENYDYVEWNDSSEREFDDIKKLVNKLDI